MILRKRESTLWFKLSVILSGEQEFNHSVSLELKLKRNDEEDDNDDDNGLRFVIKMKSFRD